MRRGEQTNIRQKVDVNQAMPVEFVHNSTLLSRRERLIAKIEAARAAKEKAVALENQTIADVSLVKPTYYVLPQDIRTS